ncbi:unnamed protein product [Penicillium salamii]|uniref:Zn(2)-C6 fungal-type domain-containing protein n=1 Tax=Penicillium salamii TaxID=1612424 RepID=A0A9W4IPJ1_9EURO|nr:unnamed protein product [Penicillium salamii]
MSEPTPRGYRPLAPRTQLLGGGDGGASPGGSAPEEKRMRRASTACTECQRRRTRCTGPPYCTECSTHARECVFDEAADRRRKASAKRTQDQLDHFRTFVDDLIGLIRDSDGPTVQLIVDTIRSGADPRHIRDTLTRILEDDVGQPSSLSNPGPHDPNLSLNFNSNTTNNMGNYYDHSPR